METAKYHVFFFFFFFLQYIYIRGTTRLYIYIYFFFKIFIFLYIFFGFLTDMTYVTFTCSGISTIEKGMVHRPWQKERTEQEDEKQAGCGHRTWALIINELAL